MSTPAHGLTLEVVWYDEDMLELRLTASNSNISVQTSFYAALDAPKEVANQISGFPSRLGEVRAVKLGSQNLPGYGGLTASFASEGNLGHLLVTLSASAAPMEATRPIETATFSLSVTPSDIDTFAQALQNMECHVGSHATLRAAT